MEELTFLDRLGTRLWDELGIGRGYHVEWHRRVEQAYMGRCAGSLWHSALKTIASSLETRGDRPHDVFWPRGIAVGGTVCWVRAAVPSEKRVYQDLQTELARYDEYDQDCWQRLLAHVATRADWNCLDTFEWLLVFAAVQRGLFYHVIRDEWKPKLFECLVSLSSRLPLDETHVPMSSVPHVRVARSPYVWLNPPSCASSDPAIDTRPDQVKPCRWETAEVAHQFYVWLSWVLDVDVDAARRMYEHSVHQKPSAEFAHIYLLRRIRRITSSRASMGLESPYVWDAEWDMLDDPMRVMSKFLPTWETSVHPLFETATLCLLPDMSEYLVARLGVWARDTSVVDCGYGHLGKEAATLPEISFDEQALYALGGLDAEAHDKTSQDSIPYSSSDLGRSGDPGDSTTLVDYTQDEAYVPSSLIERIRRGQTGLGSQDTTKPLVTKATLEQITPMDAQTSTLLMGMQGKIDDSMRELISAWRSSHVPKVSHHEIMERTCAQALKSSWHYLCTMLPQVSLGSWDTQLSSTATHSHVACRGAYEDLVELIRQLPGDALYWDHFRLDAAYGESMPSSMNLTQAYKYWCCFMGRHGTLGRCMLKRTMEHTQWKQIAVTVASSMSSMSIMFDRETVHKVGNQWSSKSMQILCVLASIAVQQLKDRSDVPWSRLCIVMLSYCVREHWMLGSKEYLVWFKALNALSSHTSGERCPDKMFPHLRFCHNWLERMCRPTDAPDELGIEWTLDQVNDLCRHACVDELPVGRLVPVEPVSPAQQSHRNKRAVLAAWSTFEKKPRIEVAPAKNLSRETFTRRGLSLLMQYLYHIIERVIPWPNEHAYGALLRRWRQDVDRLGLDVSLTHEWKAVEQGACGDAERLVAGEWLDWLEREAYRWFDRDSFLLGGRMCLFGDHEWVRFLYWSEWIGRPWSRYQRAKTRGPGEKYPDN